MARIDRPIGINFIAALMTFIGGGMTLVLVIEIFDSWRLLGMDGIAIKSLLSFLGFLIYGITPIFLYIAGAGLFLSQRWAYLSTVRFLPLLLLILSGNMTANLIRMNSIFSSSGFIRIFFYHPHYFFWAFIIYLLIVWPLISYLKSFRVRVYFGVIEK